MRRLFYRRILLMSLGPLALCALACGDNDGAKSRCKLDTDCPPGSKCKPDDGQCIVGVECTTDEVCVMQDPRRQCNPMSFACEWRPGFGDDCDADRPCAFGEFCSALLGRCQDAATSRDCARRANCPAGQICDRSANKCIDDPGCFGDDFCELGEICDTVNRTCRADTVECVRCGSDGSCANGSTCEMALKECPPPGEEPACREGEFCDIAGRCVQCTNNDQCGPGLFCNASIGRCESNLQCADDPNECPTDPSVQCVICVRPEICDRRTRRCQSPPMECENDVDCPGAQRCDLSLTVPICVPRIPDCQNDLRGEPNNTPPLAASLPESEGPLFGELRVCPGDADWYSLSVRAGTYLTVDARFLARDGDLDLQLFLADGRTLLDESRSITDNERVELDVGTDQTLLVKVFLAVPTLVPIEYRLVVSRDQGQLCPDDSNEPDDQSTSAKSLVSDSTYTGRLCSGDPDWFLLLNVPASTRINATLSFSDHLGDLDLELYRLGSSTPVLRSASVDADRELIIYDASFAGDYYLRVVGKGGDTNVYTLRADLRPNLAAVCADDRFEPDNNPGEASRAPEDTGTVAGELSICAGDQDWYLINLGPSEVLTAEIGFVSPADLDLKLYAPGATSESSAPLEVSNGISQREFIAFRPPAAGDYFLKVHGVDDRQISPYELRIVRKPPESCLPDAVDLQGVGNSMVDAFPVPPPPSRLDDLSLCMADLADWYLVAFPSGFQSSIRIQYVGSDVTLDFSLIDVNGVTLVTTQGFGLDAKEVSLNVPGLPGAGTATLFVAVNRTTGIDATYNLTIDLRPLFPCDPDFAEPNDSFALSSTHAISSTLPIDLAGLSLCAADHNVFTGTGDEDWFRLEPPLAGARIEASLEHAQGDLFLELFSPGAGRRACFNFGDDRCYSDGNGLDERVSFTATTAAPYFLRVSSIYSSPNVQLIPADANTAYDLRVNYILP